MNAQTTDAASAKLGESFVTLHLPLEPQLLLELPQPPPLQPEPLQLPQLLLELDELLLQLLQPDELDDEPLLHESQPPWWFELEQPLSHDSELLQLGPEQSQLGWLSQLLLLLELQPSPQSTDVERGGRGGTTPPSSVGNSSGGAP